MGGRQSAPSQPGGEGEEPEGPQLSYWQMMRLGYAELVNAIIRPPRAEYDMTHLGPISFEFCDKKFRRIDFQVVNDRRQVLQCSQWEPVEYPDDGRLPCVIYMHGNSSARVEALPQLSLCLALGISLVGIDFAGSGMSDGDFVSLGFYERDDLKCLIDYLRSTGRVSTIALWGRSMGAATALMHGERDPSIAAMILDSSFADLTQLADEMVEKGREHGLNVPRFVTRLTLRMIKSSVQARAGFSISHLSPITHAPRCFIPALFIAGRNDDFISPEHSRLLHDAYGGDKNLILVEGDHNSIRPRFLFDSIANFLQITLQLKGDGFAMQGAHKYVGMPPWVKMSDDQLYYEDDEVADYWADYVFDETVSSPGRLTRNDGVLGGSDGQVSSEVAHQMGIGMTQARQREVQAALYHAMGQRGPNGSGELEPPRQQPQPPPVPAPAPPQRPQSAAIPVPITTPATTTTPTADGLAGGSSGGVRSSRRMQVVREPWACSACTLINSRMNLICEACGTASPVPLQEERPVSLPLSSSHGNASNSSSSFSEPPRPFSLRQHVQQHHINSNNGQKPGDAGSRLSLRSSPPRSSSSSLSGGASGTAARRHSGSFGASDQRSRRPSEEDVLDPEPIRKGSGPR